jgi:riboflavin kinase/FMN adenylyltransferase
MDVIEYKYGDAPSLGASVMALGFFDGVHIGHRRLLSKAKNEAERASLPLTVFTFKDNRDIKKNATRIYDEGAKLELMRRLGVDTVILADFPTLSGISAEEFVKNVLVGTLGARVAVAGYNFRFGKGALGDAALLSKLAEECGIDAVICDEVRYEGHAVSSTVIRKLLSDKKIPEANALLGSPYFISGRVMHGNGVGRGLGFPTVNTNIPTSSTVLPSGVYRTAVPYNGRIYSALTNVGVCPTFEARPIHAETFILDFEGDLYGEELSIYFLDFLREETAFPSVESLKMQILVDKNKVITENGDITWQELGLS